MYVYICMSQKVIANKFMVGNIFSNLAFTKYWEDVIFNFRFIINVSQTLLKVAHLSTISSTYLILRK